MPAPKELTRGKLEGAAAAPASITYLQGPSGTDLIHCGGDSELTVEVDMTGAATGDLIITCEPYAVGNTSVMPISLPPLNTVGPTLSGGHVYFVATFDVSGEDAVRVGIKNNNAGAQTITRASWRLT